jgi:transcriptional regulator with XRE-family HTH domain
MPDRLAPPKQPGQQQHAESASCAHSAELLDLITRLKSERVRRGLSLGAVARATDQARSALSRLENGHFLNPTFNTLYRYASALRMRIRLTAEPLLDDTGAGGFRCQGFES